MVTKLSRLNDLLDYADNQQGDISNEYSKYLEGNIPSTLKIQIKNYLENLRSLLDYIASDICEDVLNLDSGHKCFFPIFCDSQTKFINHCKKNFPDLENVDSHIYSKLEDIQAFKTGDFSSLQILSRYVNENKHCDLSEQNVCVETHAASRFKVISLYDTGKSNLKQDNCDGYIIADETGVDPFLSSDYILQNIGKVIELNSNMFRYISFKFTDSNDDVIAILITLHSTISRVINIFVEPLYKKYALD